MADIRWWRIADVGSAPHAGRALLSGACMPLLAAVDWLSHGTRLLLVCALDEAAGALTDAPARLAVRSGRQDPARVGADMSVVAGARARHHVIELAAPFLDNEVIRACVAVPADERGAPGAYKALVAAALACGGAMSGFVLSDTPSAKGRERGPGWAVAFIERRGHRHGPPPPRAQGCRSDRVFDGCRRSGWLGARSP